MDYCHLTWVLAAMSVLGLTLIMNLRMIIGTSTNLISTIGWILYYISIEQYPTVSLLSTYACIYAYGLGKHAFKHVKDRKSTTLGEELVCLIIPFNEIVQK